MSKVVEICVEDPESALAAQEGGAGRVELCADRSVDGLTPGMAATARVCTALAIPVHVLIRPRAGDFVHGADEFATIRDQVVAARDVGASGVVLGLLRPDGAVDAARVAALVALARPLGVTFHKAFDATPDPFRALDDLIGLGVERVLTSGQAATAREGLGLLAALVRHAAGRIAVMAGGSVAEADLPGLRAAGVDEVHVGSGVVRSGRTDAARVRSFVEAWDRAG
jgi:copper homeostasis protein